MEKIKKRNNRQEDLAESQPISFYKCFHTYEGLSCFFDNISFTQPQCCHAKNDYNIEPYTKEASRNGDKIKEQVLETIRLYLEASVDEDEIPEQHQICMTILFTVLAEASPSVWNGLFKKYLSLNKNDAVFDWNHISQFIPIESTLKQSREIHVLRKELKALKPKTETQLRTIRGTVVDTDEDKRYFVVRIETENGDSVPLKVRKSQLVQNNITKIGQTFWIEEKEVVGSWGARLEQQYHLNSKEPPRKCFTLSDEHKALLDKMLQDDQL